MLFKFLIKIKPIADNSANILETYLATILQNRY